MDNFGQAIIVALHRNLGNFNYQKIILWCKLIGYTGIMELVIKVFGFVSGLLIIRLLPVEEYAYYTLANTMLATMVMLADSGVSNGVMAEGGKVWENKKKLGAVLNTGLNLRRKFGVWSIVIVTPVLAYLLTDHGASGWATAIIIIAVIPAFLASLSSTIFQIPIKLHQDIKSLQKNELYVNFGRLVLTLIFTVLFPFTAIVLFADGLPRIYGNLKLKKISSRFAGNTGNVEPKIKKEVMRSVKRTFPNVVYFAVSSQLMIWLVSFFGTTTSIAELGAIGRFSILFGFFSGLYATLIIPRFSRLKSTKEGLMSIFVKIQILTMVLTLALVLIIWFFSDELLWILGDSYHGLNSELLILTCSQGIGLLAGVCSQMVICRGWYLQPAVLIGINILTTILALVFLDISLLINVLYFNLLIAITSYLLVLFYGVFSIRRYSIS